MYSYRVISDIENVPELLDLGEPTISEDRITFAPTYDPGLVRRYEPAVGVRCRVIRTEDDGTAQERGGAVLQVDPIVHVSLDGQGWH